MKKTLLSIFTILGLAMTSQTITEANHAPMNGDFRYSTYQCDSTFQLSGLGATGAGANWNYSFTEHLSTLKTYTTATSTDITYNPADAAVSSASNNTLYYKSATNKLNYFGGDLVIGPAALKVKYAIPAIVALYPMSLNSTTTSITSGTINIITPFPASGAFSGTCTILADATGTMILPSKTFTNVIRVITSQTIVASTLGASVNLLIYDYYSPGTSKAPILSVNSSTIISGLGTSMQTLVTVQKDYNIVGINEAQKADVQLSVFPNPATNLINFTTTSTEATKVIAYDVTGKIIGTELIELGKTKMNTSNFATGVYMYHVVGKNNQVLTTGKFNVSK